MSSCYCFDCRVKLRFEIRQSFEEILDHLKICGFFLVNCNYVPRSKLVFHSNDLKPIDISVLSKKFWISKCWNCLKISGSSQMSLNWKLPRISSYGLFWTVFPTVAIYGKCGHIWFEVAMRFLEIWPAISGHDLLSKIRKCGHIWLQKKFSYQFFNIFQFF